MLTAMSADYIRTARAKGLTRRVIIVRHGFRNALVPLITVSALQLGALLSGAVLTEQVFTIPGFGRLIVDSVYNRDYSVVQGVVLTTATIYMLRNLLADLAYAVADPLVRRGCSGELTTDTTQPRFYCCFDDTLHRRRSAA